MAETSGCDCAIKNYVLQISKHAVSVLNIIYIYLATGVGDNGNT